MGEGGEEVQRWEVYSGFFSSGFAGEAAIGTASSIFINKLCKLSIGVKIRSFADDTVLFFSYKNWDSLHDKAEKVITLVKMWLDIN